MEGDAGWRRLAAAIRGEAARFDSLGHLATAAGLSRRTIEDLLAGQRVRYRDSTLYKLESAVGWEHGSAMRIVEGMVLRREPDIDLARIREAWPHIGDRDRRLLVMIATAMQATRRAST